MLLTYAINGIPFSQFGLVVSDSDGLLDAPLLKEPLTIDYPDMHGVNVDLSRPRYKAREISLDCFMVSATPDLFMDRWLALLAQLQRPGTQRLMLTGALTKPLVYEVYLAERIEVQKTWRTGEFVAEFTMALTEPLPIKWVMQNTAPTVSLTASCRSPLTIFWGDGSQSSLMGNTVTVAHTYGGSPGATYQIIVAGELEAMQNPQTTALTTLWIRL